METYEYRVIPAPERGVKVKGARTPEDRFAAALEAVMNALGAEGWEYHRADTLPSEERTGLTGRTTIYRNLLVFRRRLGGAQAEAAPAPGADLPLPGPVPERRAPAPPAPAARQTEAMRARQAALRAPAAPVPPAPTAPASTRDAAATAAAALRMTGRRPEAAPDGAAQEESGLARLMGERRKDGPST